MSTRKTTTNATTNNASKVNATIDFTELYTILVETRANKNALTNALNTHGYIANMRSKNANDVTTVNNDLYYQLVDGSRLFFGTNRKKVQLWLTDALYKVAKSVIPNFDAKSISKCNDSIRHYKTAKNIDFTIEWFNAFMTAYNKLYAVRFSDIVVDETK
jgi:hypothetical protein